MNELKERLYKLYIEEKRFQKTIAKMLNIPQSTVSLKLKSFNIKRKKFFSKEHREKLKLALMGNTNNPKKFSEKEAIINNQITSWNIWKKFRGYILKRDKYICQKCKRKAILIHHIKEKKYFPELCWNKENVISLCKSCHININGNNNPKGHNQYGKTN